MAIINGAAPIGGIVLRSNSTATPLLADGVFNGTAVTGVGYGIAYVNVSSDVASATDGLVVYQSSDGNNWDHTDVYTVPANGNKNYSFNIYAEHFKVSYTNGGSDQTHFRLQTIFKCTGKPSSHRIQDTISDEDDGELGVVVLKLRTAQDDYVSAASTAQGNFKISLEECNGNIKDAATGTITTVDHAHREIHDGEHFFIEDVSDLALNNVLDIQWTTPNTTEWEHFTFELNCEAETEWYIYEGVTINTPGTTITPINNDRNSSNTSSATIASILNTSIVNANADTAVAASTELAHGIIGAGRNGGVAIRDREIILKQNTVYCLRAIANAAGYTNFYVGWYEHTNI